MLPPTENRHVKDDAPYRRSGQSVCPVCATKHSIAGLIAPYSKPDSKYSLYTQATIPACTTTIQRALLACRGARNGSSRPCRRAHRRNRRPWNLVISMRFFAHELATKKLDHAMSGTRIRLRRCSLSEMLVSDQARRSPWRLTRKKYVPSFARPPQLFTGACKPWHPLMHPPAF